MKVNTEKALQFWSGLPTWAKGTLAVGGGLVLFLVGKKVYRTAFPSSSTKRNKQLSDDINSEINKLKSRGMIQGYPDSAYHTMAATIYDGMRYCFGDNYGSVEDELKKVKNDLDVALLIQAFGFRQNYCFGLPSGEPKDLLTFVKSELGNDYGGLTGYRVTRINDDWKSKNIFYQI